MELYQALVIAILQGMTELFPVSSLGHAVLLPALMHWPIDEKGEDFLPFLVVLHLGTAVALLAYFYKDWVGFAAALLGQGSNVVAERRVFFLICVATLPAVILGFLLEHPLRALFGSPAIAALFLIVNGGILFMGERIKHSGAKSLVDLSPLTALAIGACQALALIPGISRSGATMVGGVLAGLKHQEAARFSFLLATPVIAGAGVLEVPKLLHQWSKGNAHLSTMVIAGVVAGITAFLSTAFLMRYFKNHEIDALDPFAWYCWLLGGASLLFLLV